MSRSGTNHRDRELHGACAWGPDGFKTRDFLSSLRSLRISLDDKEHLFHVTFIHERCHKNLSGWKVTFLTSEFFYLNGELFDGLGIDLEGD